MGFLRERPRSILASSAVIAALVLLVACGSDDVGGAITPQPDDLDGSNYTSTKVTGHDLAPDSQIALVFKSETMAVLGGCNTQTAGYEVADDKLRWTGPAASTKKACSAALEEQDRWLAGLFTKGMTASLDGSTLTLESGDVTIVLQSTT